MRDFMSRFRFGDFAAYFLPGVVMLSAVMLSLNLTVFHATIARMFTTVSFFEAVLFACVAYVVGAFLSGSSAKIFPYIYRLSRRSRYEDARSTIHPAALREPALKGFKDTFEDDLPCTEWSLCHFYLVRSLVDEKLPHASNEALRQNDLMRLRENMIVPLIALWAVALAFSVTEFRQDPSTAWWVAGITTLVTYVAAGRLVGRAADNRVREVREICAAFVIGCRLKMFREASADARPETSPTVGAVHVAALTAAPPTTLPIRRSADPT